VSLLAQESLFFVKGTILAEKYDKFEGIFPPFLIKQLLDAAKNDEEKNLIKTRFNQFREFGDMMGINCWHMNEYESDAMWKLYCVGGKGIAIQSTFKRFKESFDICENINVNIGIVSYIDYSSDLMSAQNLFTPYLHKRISFEHEKELRAIVIKQFIIRKDEIWTPYYPIENGMYIPVELKTMIENVYVSPYSPEWYYDTVISVLSKYSLHKDVIYSKLDDAPYDDL